MKPKFLILLSILLALTAACEQGPSVTIKHSPPNQAEIFLKDGSRILIDVTVEKDLTAPPTERDILLVTHAHPDHYLKGFVDGFPGKKIIFEEGSLEGDGYTLRAISSGHNEGDDIEGPLSTNYMFIIETNGIRIAHLGDLGQTDLTPEQLEALGPVDICFSQIENSFSGVSLTNKKGFHYFDQIKPRYVFLTHFKERSLEYAVQNYPAVTGGKDTITLKKKAFPPKMTLILAGDQSAAYRKIYNLKALPGTK